MATIKAIENRSIHQIQSGQVIVDLNSVVKELVENSLDAGATSVEIRFRNQGLDAIEVQDNGNGIAPENFETVALKHHTSKLSSYEDLNSLDTFGFRGEALSSLCALSRLQILTARSQDGAVGHKLDFDISGTLQSSSIQAAQRGTTVYVGEVFHNLPVRRKELEKHIKREYSKVLSLLYQYACISVGVRFSVSNQMPKGKKASAFSTKANATTKENISNVFGAKALLGLVKLDLHLELTPSQGPSIQSAHNWSFQAPGLSGQILVEGHISKPVFGDGRNAPDRQMFFVNSRPCALPQVSKAINEVYKSFNLSQSPFVFANLKMNTNAYDVNVSPDKRTILLHDQAALLENLKTALTELFEHTDHTMPQSTLPQRRLPSYQPVVAPPASSDGSRASVDSDGSQAEDDLSESEAVVSDARDDNQTSLGDPSRLLHSWIERDIRLRKDAPDGRRQTSALRHPKPDVGIISQRADESSDPLTATRSRSQGFNVLPHEEDILGEPTTRTTECNETSSGNVKRADDVQLQPESGSMHAEISPQHPQATMPVDEEFEFGPRTTSTLAKDKTHYQISDTRWTGDDTVNPETEPAIITYALSSQKASPGPIQSAFDRMRPKRTQSQTAEITVGDRTTTTVIGSGSSYKRRRVHQPINSQAIAYFGGSPSLAQSLRRKFAAPDSQLEDDVSDVAENELSEFSDPDRTDDMSSVDNSVVRPGADNNHTRARVRAGIPHALGNVSSDSEAESESDGDYVDESEKKNREDEKIARLIREAEETAAWPTDEKKLRRASQALKNGGNRKDSPLQLACTVTTTTVRIARQLAALSEWPKAMAKNQNGELQHSNDAVKDSIDDTEAESRLSLTVSKSDFASMQIVGQFNLGFILAIRPAQGPDQHGEDLFIVDQHAADEKYNYERLQHTEVLRSQRLVHPHLLELTATEEEVILNHSSALKANGFEIETSAPNLQVSAGAKEDGKEQEEDDNNDDDTNDDIDDDDDDDEDNEEAAAERSPRQFRLLALPMSREKTFALSDLEELLHLLSESTHLGTSSSASSIPRPRKVQQILAMRACRSSIMVGKTLTPKQMERVVGHMGEMEKPWNCPHGRPTMRHLAGLGAWQGWREGEVIVTGEDEDDDDRTEASMGGERTDWPAWLAGRR